MLGGSPGNLELIRAYWFVETSSTLRNEPWNAGFHYFIQSLSRLNSIDFVQRVLRKGGDVEILSRAGRTPGRRKQSSAALHRPRQQHLCAGVFPTRAAMVMDGLQFV